MIESRISQVVQCLNWPMIANFTALFTCKLVTYFRMASGSGGIMYQLSDPKTLFPFTQYSSLHISTTNKLGSTYSK